MVPTNNTQLSYVGTIVKDCQVNDEGERRHVPVSIHDEQIRDIYAVPAGDCLNVSGMHGMYVESPQDDEEEESPLEEIHHGHLESTSETKFETKQAKDPKFSGGVCRAEEDVCQHTKGPSGVDTQPAENFGIVPSPVAFKEPMVPLRVYNQDIELVMKEHAEELQRQERRWEQKLEQV